MIDPEDVNYVCTLSAASLAKAKTELFEDPKERLAAVQQLRKWIREQKHLTCRTDTVYMLQVLRTAKFSQLRAREIIETILTLTTKFPQYLVNIDCHEPGIIKHIRSGASVPLPKPDKEGRWIIILRVGQNDLTLPEMIEARAGLAVNALLKEKNEDMIVNGELLVFDMTGVSARHIARTAEGDKNINKIYQECMLGRMKAMHFYNGGSFFELAMSIVRPFIKKKYLERMHVHSTMESLYEMIPMEFWPDEYLPDDYSGPSAGPMKNIVDDLTQRLLDPKFRDRLLDYTSDRYKIDEKLAKTIDAPRESFRKLNVD
jgi:hypothetical protein